MLAEKLLTTEEVAVQLRCRPNTVLTMAKDGRLPSVRLTNRVLFTESAIAEAIEKAKALTKSAG
jgi:excisionase family DNA binding protein